MIALCWRDKKNKMIPMHRVKIDYVVDEFFHCVCGPEEYALIKKFVPF